MGEITKIKIFPSIGIARVGNSPDEYFIGPEIPGQYDVPEGGFKDGKCCVKRQAARFRLYGYDDVAGSKPIEITAQNAETITWTVQLANKKASSECIFRSIGIDPEYRNQWYKEIIGGDPKDFSMLDIFSIRPSARSLTGANQKPVKFDDGTFYNKDNKGTKVLLGEMLTDELGRLIVLGGLGTAGGTIPENVQGFPQIIRTFNTAGWYDDIADGPVTASVKLKNGKEFSEMEVAPAWVISAPPDYAPQIYNITTLYDVLRQVALNIAVMKNNWPDELINALKIPNVPSFARDVQPLLQRVLDLRWVNQTAYFGAYSHGNTFSNAAPPNWNLSARQKIFKMLRPPGITPPLDSPMNMPLMYDDDQNTVNGKTILTPTQYEIMKKWADEKWVDPEVQLPPPFENPEDLTRAALDACVGGALYPGIEAGRFLRDVCDYTEPFRINHNFIKEDGTKIEAGDVTKGMSNPWQADFFMCRASIDDTPNNYAWWPAQRPDKVLRDINSENLVLWTGSDEEANYHIIDSNKDPGRLEMTTKWHQLGFVVKVGDKFVETERTSVCADLFLILDRSHFSKNEVPATFPNSFYVVVEGFTPAELGIMEEKPPLQTIAPKVTFTRADDNSTAKGIFEHVQELLFEIKPFDAQKRQRLTFIYKIEFANADDFKPIGNQTIKLTATKQDPKYPFTYSAAGEVTLFEQPNPYMQDGEVSWLSKDVRVFKILEGEGLNDIQFGTIEGDTEEDMEKAGAQAASTFIKSVVKMFNDNQTQLEGHPFEQLTADQADSALEFAVKTKIGKDFKRAFNFAVARVRYSGNAEATDVRVFFRLFTTAATGLDFQKESTYRRSDGSNPVALLGLQGGNIVSIPCYADLRAESEAKQTDGLNINTLPASDKERYCYFGCWLDFNQTAPRLTNPLNTSEKKSIQDQIRGLHQCLVAEIYFPNDLIPEGATPAASENLAQRNLMIVASPNPGSPPSRLIQHTFEIKATHNTPAFTAAVGGALPLASSQKATPDELMIRWNNLPPSSQVTLYMPSVDAEVLNLAEKNYEARRLVRTDAHTIRCLPADVTYVPLPTGRTENIPALLTIELPEGIRRGEEFNVVVHQISGRPRRILGAFQLNIPVSDKTVLLEREEQRLSVLRHIFRSISVDDRWYPVFVRYLEQVAGRVSGFGGDPDSIIASPDGTGSEAAKRCARLGWLTSLALSLFIILAGLHPLANYLPEIVAGILLLAIMMVWVTKCSPSVCRIIVTCLVGLGVGAALLAILLLAGFAQQQGLIVLALSSLGFGAVAVAGVLSGCLSFAEKQET